MNIASWKIKWESAIYTGLVVFVTKPNGVDLWKLIVPNRVVTLPKIIRLCKNKVVCFL